MKRNELTQGLAVAFAGLVLQPFLDKNFGWLVASAVAALLVLLGLIRIWSALADDELTRRNAKV